MAEQMANGKWTNEMKMKTENRKPKTENREQKLKLISRHANINFKFAKPKSHNQDPSELFRSTR